jgi:hypothetical protein
MPIKVTNKQVKIHQDFHEFCPRWSLEKKEYEQARITSVDEKPHRFNSKSKGDLAEPLTHWARFPVTEELAYFEFIDKITDSKQNNKFYPARDEDRRPIPKTRAMHVITDIMRIKRDDESEVLLSKGNIIAYDAAGEEVSFYLPWPEKWIKTLFEWRNEYNNSTKSFERICLGPKDGVIQYQLPFNKENAKSFFDQRANDQIINFIVKDEISNEAREVAKDVNAQKTFERFANNSFDYLWSGQYIPVQVRAELRQEAVARGYIKGVTSDFQPPLNQQKQERTLTVNNG